MMTKKMSELTTGMRFQDENGNVWTLAEKNSKAKTVILVDAEGNSKPHGLTTFNKRYTEADGIIAVVHVEDITADAETGTAPAEVAETEVPITEEKPKKERKTRKAAAKFVPEDADPDVINLIFTKLPPCFDCYTVVEWGIKFKNGNRRIAEFYIAENGFTFWCVNTMADNLAEYLPNTRKVHPGIVGNEWTLTADEAAAFIPKLADYIGEIAPAETEEEAEVVGA